MWVVDLIWGMKVAEIAKELGISRETLLRWRRNREF